MALNRITWSIRHKIWADQKLTFSTSCCVKNKWRIQQGLEPNPRRYGALIQGPDFSYVDGRPVALSFTKRKKLELQKSYCEKIIKMSYELDFAVKRHEEMLRNEEARRKEIIESKLKPKGSALLKK